MIFKREKEVARRLEFDGLYVTEQPPEEDIKGQWDRLVINTPYVHSHKISWADVTLTSSKNMFCTLSLRSLLSASVYSHGVGCTVMKCFIFLVNIFYIFNYYLSRSFPSNYWDKFVKRKVRSSEDCDTDYYAQNKYTFNLQ